FPAAQDVRLHLGDFTDFLRPEDRSIRNRGSSHGLRQTAVSIAESAKSGPFSLSGALPDGQPDRRALVAERLPDAVHEEALVGKVKLGGDVREQDERRRGRAGLDAVKNS